MFISGGCKNGKSTYAEEIAVKLHENSKDTPLYYIATMKPVDSEDNERIERHRRSRKGLGFTTVEIGTDIGSLMELCNMEGTFLLDSLTALLANEMFDSKGRFHESAGRRVSKELESPFVLSKNMVVVSDFIYSDSALYDRYTQGYRRELAYLDKAAAKASDVVLEVCYGNIIAYKGRELLAGLLNLGEAGV